MHWPIRYNIALNIEGIGIYGCVCYISVKIIFTYPPVFCLFVSFSVAPTIQEIKSGTVAPGRSGLIRCEGAGVPPPAFEWYKGEKK